MPDSKVRPLSGWGRLLVVTMALVLALTVALRAAAQDASPPTGEVPDPARCRIEPRPLEFFEPLVSTPPTGEATPTAGAGPAPFVMPAGLPADEATVATITATVGDAFACFNAGDYRRGLALFTDDYLTRTFGVPGGLTPDFMAVLTAPPVPVAEADRFTILGVCAVSVLPDGQVGAIFEVFAPLEAPEAVLAYLVFAQEGDRYVIADFVPGVDVQSGSISTPVASRGGQEPRRSVTPSEETTVG